METATSNSIGTVTLATGDVVTSPAAWARAQRTQDAHVVAVARWFAMLANQAVEMHIGAMQVVGIEQELDEMSRVIARGVWSSLEESDEYERSYEVVARRLEKAYEERDKTSLRYKTNLLQYMKMTEL